jgi:hypothetical protein
MDFTRAAALKRGILLFWALWISVVVAMNVGDVLKAMGILPADWKLASGNYHAIVDVTKVYGTPHWLDMVLLLGVILWEGVAAALFWWARARYRDGHRSRWRAVYLAFSSLLALFGTFILTDELFHAYKVEGDHRGIAVLLLASLLALQLLPDRLPSSG